jgi:thioesterase domain-containing protein
MNAAELQKYLEDHIPIVQANGFRVVSADPDRVVIGGRLADHVNHRDSAFGGSLSTALILAAWGQVRTDTFAPNTVIVIAQQRVSFNLPVLQDFEAVSLPLSTATLDRARALLGRFHKARFTVEATIVHQGDSGVRAEFAGEFVVVS